MPSPSWVPSHTCIGRKPIGLTAEHDRSAELSGEEAQRVATCRRRRSRHGRGRSGRSRSAGGYPEPARGPRRERLRRAHRRWRRARAPFTLPDQGARRSWPILDTTRGYGSYEQAQSGDRRSPGRGPVVDGGVRFTVGVLRSPGQRDTEGLGHADDRSPRARSSASSTTDQTVGMPKAAVNLAALTLGTGKSSSTPKVGYLDRCGGTPSGGPPVFTPPWVNTARGTWNAKTKAAVQGTVIRKATFTATHTGSNEVLTGNGLPARSGTFPVAQSDPAFAYNPDEGSITAHAIKLTLPYNPKLNTQPRCEAGTVGIAVDGIPILDGFDAGGNDAGGVETQDTCHGHPNNFAGYHYHSLSPCLLSTTARTHSTQVGWALDGFGIYVEYNSKGQLLTNSNLDVCHGRTSAVLWHGKTVSVYHYDMTFEFPFTVGCFRGTASPFFGMATSTQPTA